jgi:acetyltransferase-like isoleucine patch superfamily enzyme
MRWLVGQTAEIMLSIAYRAQRAEGLNALFQLIPARFLIPTLRKYGASIGDEVQMLTPVIFHNVSDHPGHHYANLHIGSQVYIGKEVFFDLADRITIEDRVTVSMRVTLLTHTHAGESPLTDLQLRPSYAPVLLRQGCYIGAAALIMQGVTVGEMAVVGAGAVVCKDVPPRSTVVGVPARVIKGDNR